ncbi:hypothetical protein Bbelb_417370, partial [Branchiostoma belcheri]
MSTGKTQANGPPNPAGPVALSQRENQLQPKTCWLAKKRRPGDKFHSLLPPNLPSTTLSRKRLESKYGSTEQTGLGSAGLGGKIAWPPPQTQHQIKARNGGTQYGGELCDLPSAHSTDPNTHYN